MLAKSKTVKMAWKQLEDVVAAHLHAIRAIGPTDEIAEILLKKTYGPGTDGSGELEEFAEIHIRYTKGN